MSIRSEATSSPDAFSPELRYPDGAVHTTLMLVIWAAAVIYVLRSAGVLGQLNVEKVSSQIRAAPVPEMLSVTLGLSTASLTPWIFKQSLLFGGLFAAISFAAILFATINRQVGRSGVSPSISLGVLAAGSTLLLCGAFASVIEFGLTVSPTIPALLAMLSCAFIAVKVQLSMGSPIAYSVTIIWAFLGLLVATVNADPMIATAAVLAITFVSVALIRSAS